MKQQDILVQYALQALLNSLETEDPGLTELLNNLAQEVAPWEPDIVAVQSITATDQPIMASLRIRCPQALVEELRGGLGGFLQNYPDAELL